jgi:hypothetical protein
MIKIEQPGAFYTGLLFCDQMRGLFEACFFILLSLKMEIEPLLSDDLTNSDDSYANTQDLNQLHPIGPGYKKKWFPDIFPEYAPEYTGGDEPRTPSKTNISPTVGSYKPRCNILLMGP